MSSFPSRPAKADMNLLERAIASVDQRLVLLAPSGRCVPEFFENCDFDYERHRNTVEAVQTLRGRVYLADGAIEEHQLSADGLHQTPEDDNAWHLVLHNDSGDATACAWFREHDNSVHFAQLRVRHSALAQSPQWRDKLWYAVQAELTRARADSLRYAELGGWAVADESRHKGDSFMLALVTYSLARACGGALGVTTATTRHASASMLSRIGGRPLLSGTDVIPPYYDPQYRCVMELLRFDSRAPEKRFHPLVNLVHSRFSTVPVVARPYWPMTMPARPYTNFVPPHAGVFVEGRSAGAA